MESKERIKLYIVIGLAAIFVAVGYFRFLHGKITFFNKSERGGAIPALIEVPAVDLKGIQPAGQQQKKALDGPRAALRDIFAPAKAPAKTPAKETAKETAAGSPSAAAAPAAAAAVPQPLPPLQLTGTIIGGKRPMAVINGQLLRKGDMIAGFEVVSIAKDQVTLSGGGRKVLVNLLTGVEERSP